MRDRSVRLRAGRLEAGTTDGGAWLELTTVDAGTTAELTPGELLMAIEALAMVYADTVQADAASVARGVNRTLRNRTQGARERHRKVRRVA